MINSKGFEENLYYGNGDKRNKGNGKEGWMRCNSGVYIDIFNPNEKHLLIEDIAHGLSMMPRFGGHFPVWYSVADHCLYCAKLIEQQNGGKQEIFNALMHDCSEAYLMDIISPLKKLLINYSELEDNFMRILSRKFKFEYPIDFLTKNVDKYALEREWKVVIGESKSVIRDNITSKEIFLEAYEKYRIN